MDDDGSVSTGGTAADRAERLTRSMSDQSFPNVKPAAFALAAVRETYEETGIMLGVPATRRLPVLTGPWQAFARAGIAPDLSAIHFVARAITPPRRPLRFDSRFFTA